MTLTLELPLEMQNALEAEAQRVGMSAPQLVRRMVAEALSEQQDLEDVEEARRILAETKPEDWVSWEQVKAEMALKSEAVPAAGRHP